MSQTNQRVLTRIGILLLVGVGLLGSPALRAQNGATVKVSDVSVVASQVTSVKVSISNGPDAGLSDFDGTIQYDPTVANVVEVNGLNDYSIAAFNIDNDNGEVRFIGFKVSGKQISDGGFLELRVRATGNPGDSTNLQLSLRTLNDPDGNAISHSIQNGTFQVTSTQALKADFSFEPTSPNVGQQIQFTDQSSGGGTIESWQWDFDDGSTSSNQNPTHTYSSGGTYSVKLTVEDDRGNTDSVTKQVPVGGGTITFPVRNFPNPAAEQTTFVYDLPDGTSAATLHVYTLDGRLAHQTSLNVDQSEYDWNLTDQPEGIYYYRVTATLPSGSAISNVGKLVIAR
ncbi:MAG: PKD domain-containing protein [Candidatus Bipolaricaulia bacterium]